MKITALFVAFVAAADHMGISDRHSTLDTDDNVAHSHLNGAGIQTQNEVVNDQNARSNFNQATRAPSAAPASDLDIHTANYINPLGKGTTTQIATQTGVAGMPTSSPTPSPTKITDLERGSSCTSTVSWTGGITTRKVGWVGPGPGAEYCNIWKCEPGQSTFTEKAEGTQTAFNGTPAFKTEKQVCSIQKYAGSVCSHTSCTFETSTESAGRRIVLVRSDHREETGGEHMCGYSKHTDGCTCICSGARRQDATGFERTLAAGRIVSTATNGGTHDETTDGAGTWDSTNNANNFYSKHSNNGKYVATTAAQVANRITYSENDNAYTNGDYVAHRHVNSDPNA